MTCSFEANYPVVQSAVHAYMQAATSQQKGNSISGTAKALRIWHGTGVKLAGSFTLYRPIHHVTPQGRDTGLNPKP